MAPLRFAAALVAGFLFVSSSVTAADARGEVEATSIRIADSARLESLGLDLLALGTTPAQVDLVLTDVAIQRLGSTTIQRDGPLPSGHAYDTIDERASYATATVSIEQGSGDQIVALRSLGPAAATLGPSTVRGVASAFLASAGGNGGEHTCARAEVPEFCLDVFGSYELAGDAVVELTGGEISALLLYGPTLRVVSEGETTEYASGLRDTQSIGPVSQREESWVIVRAKTASGTILASAASLYSTAPTIRAAALEFQNADGSVRVGARDYRASNDDIFARGALVLTPGPVPAATTRSYDGTPVYASAFTTRLSGDVQSINLNANPVFLDTPAKQAGVAALLAILVAGVVYAWQHISFLSAALYTRLNKPDILDNEVRSNIYEIIRQNPGISAREVHRRSEQSWGTVVYHLRQLERHHLVVSRSLGRTRNYYENHGKYRGMEVQLACLQSERARVLARAITRTPGITQEQLAAASGYPQPTTSYYVRKLKQAGLVEERRQGRYVKYVPHADLPRFIALSERPVDVGATAASGVQA